MATIPRMGRARAGGSAPPRRRRAHRRTRGPGPDDPRLGTRRPSPIRTVRAAVPQAGPASGNEDGAEPQPAPMRSQEGTELVRRRTFVELTGISLAGAMLPGAAAASPTTGIEPLVLMLTGAGPEPPAAPPDLTVLALSVARARKDYQACRPSIATL